MSKHRFSISNEDTSELDSNKELYRWYHDYLPPIATLFNAKLGDQSGDAVSFSTDFEPLPETLEDALLNPGEQAALQELMAEGSEDPNRTEEDLAQSALEHPAFSDEANVSFGLGGSGYDRQTGVPSAEVPCEKAISNSWPSSLRSSSAKRSAPSRFTAMSAMALETCRGSRKACSW